MSITREPKKRKRKVQKGQTYNARRNADRAQRARKRARTERRERMRRHYKFKVRIVRYYRQLREQMSEQEAARRTLARWQPTQPWHFPLCLSSIRQWHREVGSENQWFKLYPKSTRPQSIHYQVPEVVVGIIFTLRKLFGWGGHRIAAELKERQMAEVSGQGVYNILGRLGLPVKLYALKGRSDGIAYQRYEKARPNEQWHIDLKHAQLSDGSKVYICILVDDYSRYALAAMAGTSATTEWVTQVVQQTLRRCGQPKQVVSDNGREFVSVWENVLTQFGQLLLAHGIKHLTSAPYYPQGNGKAEAFIKTLARELLETRTFDTLEELQQALDHFLTYYNNYRLHSALGWKSPASHYTGRTMTLRGLAGIPGIEPMAAKPEYAPAYCDPPFEITPFTAQRAGALALRPPSAIQMSNCV